MYLEVLVDALFIAQPPSLPLFYQSIASKCFLDHLFPFYPEMYFITFFTILSAASIVAASPMIFEARAFDNALANSKTNENINEGLSNGQSNMNKGVVKGDYTVSQAIDSCGNSQLNCCNSVDQGDQSAEGFLGIAAEVLGGVGVGCSPIAAGT